MAKKEVKAAKEPVKLREKELANGSKSLYLDIYRNGRRTREYLKLYIVPVRTKADQTQNTETLATAQAIKAKRQIELQNGEYSFTKQYKEDTPFLGYYRQMCARRFRNDSKGNWGNWRSCLKHLERYCDEFTTFREIDKDWIEGFKEYLDTAEKDQHKKTDKEGNEVFVPLSQNSKLSYFNKLRACLNDAYENHIIVRNPMRGIENYKTAEVKRAYLTMEEIKLLKETHCEYPWLKNSFLFSCLTGLRKSDIEKLTWGDVEKMDGYTRIVFKQKKTGGQEYLDINAQAAQYMGERGNPVDRVFTGFKYGAFMLTELRKWVESAGIHKDITFHCARHTFAVLMIDLGADIYTVSKLLGHKELATTQIYTKVLDKNKRAAINLIPEL